MWFQFSVPERLRPFGRKPTGSDPIFPADPSWQNKKFLQEQPLELERLRSPVSTDSLLVIHPEDLESPEICKQIHTALQKKDRILLFKAFSPTKQSCWRGGVSQRNISRMILTFSKCRMLEIHRHHPMRCKGGISMPRFKTWPQARACTLHLA